MERRLGLMSAAALVVANMIGAGVFTTSGFALADLHRRDTVLLAWFVGGLLAMCGALSYGALARRIPQSGGEYTFLTQTVHPLAGFLAGWVSLLAGFTAPIAAAGLALQAYLGEVVSGTMRPEWIATAAILAAGAMHGLRLQVGVVLQNSAVALKIVLIVVFVVIGVCSGPVHTDSLMPAGAGSSVPAFAVTLVWVSFSYSGWNAAVYVAGELRDPQRNLHRALILATGTVTVLYLALNAVFLYAAPAAAIAGKAEIGAIAAEALGGERLRHLLSLLVALALFTSISSMVMAGPRVYARMAQDGFLPRWFGREGDVPAAAVFGQVVLAIIVCWMSGLRQLLGYIGFTLSLSAAATIGGLIILRLREGATRVPVPGFPWVPGLFIIVTLATAMFMIVREPLQGSLGLLTVIAGLPLYWMRSNLTVPPAIADEETETQRWP